MFNWPTFVVFMRSLNFKLHTILYTNLSKSHNPPSIRRFSKVKQASMGVAYCHHVAHLTLRQILL